MSFKGLSMCEAYREGRLVVALRIKARAAPKLDCICVTRSKGYPAETTAVRKAEVFDVRPSLGSDQTGMLVFNVEHMEVNKPLPLPFTVGLYNVKDVVADSRAGPLSHVYMSFDGTEHRLAITLGMESPHYLLPGRLPVVFDQLDICVVESGPEIVERIAQDGWAMLGEGAADSDTPRLTVILGNDSLFVSRNVDFENTFKLVDVMFGPFGL